MEVDIWPTQSRTRRHGRLGLLRREIRTKNLMPECMWQPASTLTALLQSNYSNRRIFDISGFSNIHNIDGFKKSTNLSNSKIERES